MMKVGILEAGTPPSPLQEQFGTYGAMIQQLLGTAYEFVVYDARRSELPRTTEACDAYIITGSAAGVHDGEPWIGTLEEFVQRASGRSPMIGVCFGHQLMAQAYGGQVARSRQGWGVGLHRYRICGRAAWMDDVESIAVPVSHQDQIVRTPAGAQVLAGSDFTPYAILAYPDRRAISVQCHPEFTPAYAAALIELRRNSVLSGELADRALQTLHQPNDRALVGAWLARFLDCNIPA